MHASPTTGAKRTLIAGWRLLSLVTVLVYTAVDAFVRQLSARHRTPAYRGWMLHVCARRALAAFGVEMTVTGTPPAHGLIVSNHLSYMDILALGMPLPVNFVSKAEVRSWPLLGYLGHSGGSILIDRSKPSGVRAVNEEIEKRLRDGGTVGLFPEGTTTDGTAMLPFRTPLFRPAAVTKTPVWPAAIRYTAPGHDLAAEVCYWGDMTLLPHLLHLATIESLQLEVLFADEPVVGDDARVLAAESQRQVELLLQRPPGVRSR